MFLSEYQENVPFTKRSFNSRKEGEDTVPFVQSDVEIWFNLFHVRKETEAMISEIRVTFMFSFEICLSTLDFLSESISTIIAQDLKNLFYTDLTSHYDVFFLYLNDIRHQTDLQGMLKP